MRINTKNNTSKYILIATTVLLFLVLSSLAWWYFSDKDDSVPVSSDSSTQDEPTPDVLTDEAARSKKDFVENQQEQSATPSSNSGIDAVPTGSEPPSKLSLETKQNGSSVTVMTRITGIGDGTCKLEVSNGGQSFSEQAEVIYQPSYSSCAGFSVPVSSVGKGTWSITVSVTSASGEKAAAVTSLEVS